MNSYNILNGFFGLRRESLFQQHVGCRTNKHESASAKSQTYGTDFWGGVGIHAELGSV